jgi:uncharacterized protein YPO0396
MNERDTDQLLETLRDMNRNIENGLERINDSLKKIAEDIRSLE